jgi:hypothetical protein
VANEGVFRCSLAPGRRQVFAYAINTGPQPYSLVVTGAFRKDFRLYNSAIPATGAVASDGTQVGPTLTLWCVGGCVGISFCPILIG